MRTVALIVGWSAMVICFASLIVCALFMPRVEQRQVPNVRKTEIHEYNYP